MSNRELEIRDESDFATAVAAALGISVDELDELNWRIEDHNSDDGLVYGHNVYFDEGSDITILGRIAGLGNKNWIRIGPIAG